jgi:hypothetical protein
MGERSRHQPIIISRPGVPPKQKLIWKMAPVAIYIPKGQSYGGYTNIVVSRELIMPALSIFDDIARTDNPDEMLDGNMKSLIARRWRDMNLNVVSFEGMFFACSKPGDTTRWNHGGDIHRTPDHIKELGIYGTRSRVPVPSTVTIQEATLRLYSWPQVPMSR